MALRKITEAADDQVVSIIDVHLCFEKYGFKSLICSLLDASSLFNISIALFYLWENQQINEIVSHSRLFMRR